ncbi:Hybrid signal transduction histidine kinase A [Penicillium subrubescens]|uniref:histidine kinase n=1 Tax=Penicillium subrubescens TaxID=1316194 RepID=A0A1Q5UD72_9EURO|nr:Hybrid signal transduction histidine kinase A [Penicillium subrubescens]
MDPSSIDFMKHMAATVMEHLDTVRSKHLNSQAKRMIFGLGSFVEGKTTLRDSWLEEEEQQEEADSPWMRDLVEGQLNKNEQDLQETQTQMWQLTHRPMENVAFSKDEESNKRHKVKATYRSSDSDAKLPDDTTPAALQRIFFRAANLIRESIEVEGVVFLDARIESFGGLVGYETTEERTRSSSEDSTNTGSGDSASLPTPSFLPPNSEENPTTCRTLGYSTTQSSTRNDCDRRATSNNYAVRESVLMAMMNRYPHGKIFNYTQDGSLSDDSSTSAGTQGSEGSGKRPRRRHKQDADDLSKAFGGARSIIFLPLWDTHRSRWLSGVFVWTNTPKRVFTAENELAYLRAFSNSVMAEVHMLDVEMAEKAKTNLVTSISHELRSPLHGILGTADILGDTAMNALQQGMVHTIESCGRTLLDTINHLLDFTYIDKFKQDPKLKKKKKKEKQHRRSTVREASAQEQANLERTPPSSIENAFEDVQLDSVLEEVAESVFAGHSFYHHPRAQHRHGNAEASQATHQPKQVTIIFDIQEAAEWKFYTQAGCWRRILMNVFSNALKYTTHGYIYLRLTATEASCPERKDSDGSPEPNDMYLVTLTVKDTGQGIGTNFLRNGLFAPFSQEDTLAPGSGLGLSIVQKILRSLDGSIEVNSEKDRGTEISIQVPLKLASLPDTSDGSSSNAAYSLLRKEGSGKTIGLLGFGSSASSDRDVTLYNALKRVCEDWFHLTVKTASLHGNRTPCDFYLMVHTDLDGPDAEENQQFNLHDLNGISPLIVICQSPEIAHNMFARTMALKRDRDSIVEFISQPCGPRKLAKTLELCIRQLHGEDTHREEGTRWVEMPESSHLPLDIDTRDAPRDRMKISKRPTTDTVRSQDSGDLGSSVGSPHLEHHPMPDGESAPTHHQPYALLVEDNPVNLRILKTFVTKEGWSCETASNGLEAVERFRENPSKFAVVIIGRLNSSRSTSTKLTDNSDISMPIMNGFKASRTIRQFEREHFDKKSSSKPRWYPTSIIALTGLDSAAAQQEAFASGIDTFLTKPIKRQDIRALLERCKP